MPDYPFTVTIYVVFNSVYFLLYEPIRRPICMQIYCVNCQCVLLVLVVITFVFIFPFLNAAVRAVRPVP